MSEIRKQLDDASCSPSVDACECFLNMYFEIARTFSYRMVCGMVALKRLVAQRAVYPP